MKILKNKSEREKKKRSRRNALMSEMYHALRANGSDQTATLEYLARRFKLTRTTVYRIVKPKTIHV